MENSNIDPEQQDGVIDKRLIVILLIVFVQMVGAAMVFPILPVYAKREFGMNPATITLLNTVFFAAQFLAGPYIGRLSDKYGRIPVLLVSQIGTVLAFLLLGFGNAIWILFFARILDGITGGNIIVAQAYITDITSPKQRTQALGYIFSAFGLGFIIGPAIGGLLASRFSYQTPYIVAAVAASIVVFLTYFVLEETITDEKKLENKENKGQQLNIRFIISNIPLLSILLITFGAQFAFSMLQSTFALFGEVVLFADNPEQAEMGIGLLFAMIGVGLIITQMFLIKRLVKRFGDSSIILIGGIIRSVSMFILILIAVPISAGLTLFLFAVGTGMQMPALQSLITNTVPDNQRGTAMGLYQSAMNLSIIIGSAIAGVLFEIAPITPYIVGSIIFAIMLIPTYFLMLWAKKQSESPVVVG